MNIIQGELVMKRTMSVFGVLMFFALVIFVGYAQNKVITRSTEWASKKLDKLGENEYDVIVVGSDAEGIAAAIGALKGPRHGGANIKVVRMFDDIKANIKDYGDEEEIATYLEKILNKEAFDHSGLIYGMGHAIYSVSDPRARVFKGYVERLSNEKGKQEEFKLYNNVERIAAQLISKRKNLYKPVSANVDFYSGFVYSMLELPKELFTPLFAVARIAGWGAHRIEELSNSSRIIRPAYENVMPRRPYVNLDSRAPEITAYEEIGD